MTRTIKFVLPFLLLWVSAATADQIRLRADNWCPYNCEPDAPHPGFMIEIAQEIFTSAGHVVDYQLLNWSRALSDVRAGIADGAVGAYKTDAPDLVFPHYELAVSVNCFFVSATQPWTYTGVPSLTSISLGVIKDYSYGPSVDQYVAESKTDFRRIQISSGEDALGINLRKLAHGRIDALIEDQFVFDHFLLTHPPTHPTKRAGCDDHRNNVYIGFSPVNTHSADYAAIFDRGLETLRQSGRLAQIMSHYRLGGSAQ